MMSLTSVALLSGCLSEQKEMEANIAPVVGVWHYSGQEQGFDVDVYLCFDADCTFEMYQFAGEGAYKLFYGTFSVDNFKNISGVYESGRKWARTYKVKSSSNKLKLSCDAGSWEYTKVKSVPQEVKNQSVVTRTVVEEVIPFL